MSSCSNGTLTDDGPPTKPGHSSDRIDTPPHRQRILALSHGTPTAGQTWQRNETRNHGEATETLSADHPDVPGSSPRMCRESAALRTPRDAETQRVRDSMQDQQQACGQCLRVAVGTPRHVTSGETDYLPDLRCSQPLSFGDQGDACMAAVRYSQQRSQAPKRQTPDQQAAQVQQQPDRNKP